MIRIELRNLIARNAEKIVHSYKNTQLDHGIFDHDNIQMFFYGLPAFDSDILKICNCRLSTSL
jgi:hypothetical protein